MTAKPLPPLSPFCVDCGVITVAMVVMSPGVDCGNRALIVADNHEWLLCSPCWLRTTRAPTPLSLHRSRQSAPRRLPPAHARTHGDAT